MWNTTRQDGRRARSIAVVLVVAAMLLALGACDTAPDGAQPVTESPVFGSGAFDELPRVPGSDEAGPVGRSGGATSRTYTSSSYGPERVLGFYRTELAAGGWTMLVEPAPSGAGIWRGDWLRDGRRLEVVARPVASPGDAEPGTVVGSSYSLILNADAADNPVYTASTAP